MCYTIICCEKKSFIIIFVVCCHLATNLATLLQIQPMKSLGTLLTTQPNWHEESKVQILWEGHEIWKKYHVLFESIHKNIVGGFLKFVLPSRNIWTLVQSGTPKVSYLAPLVKLRYCDKATKFEKNNSIMYFDIYSVTSKQVGDCFSKFWAFSELFNFTKDGS